jgi:hypothetical protein
MGAREVSSTVIIKDDQVASMFDEQYRAWSLSSQYWDSVSLSSETCNETTAPGWTISEASYATLAKVVADWCIRYGIACNRTQIMGHREVYTRYGASYATACPGGIDLDRVVNDAAAIINGGSDMSQADVDAINAHTTAEINRLADYVRRESRPARLYKREDGTLWIAGPTVVPRAIRPDTPAEHDLGIAKGDALYLGAGDVERPQPISDIAWNWLIKEHEEFRAFLQGTDNK